MNKKLILNANRSYQQTLSLFCLLYILMMTLIYNMWTKPFKLLAAQIELANGVEELVRTSVPRNQSELLLNNSLIHSDFRGSNNCIYWYTRGRLGNSMYQYAALLALATDTGKIPVLLNSHNKLGNDKLESFFTITHPEQSLVECRVGDSKIAPEQSAPDKIYNVTLAWDSSLKSKILDENYTAFRGFPNSYRYFVNHKSLIFQEFRLIPKIQSSAHKFLDKVRNENLKGSVADPRSLVFVGVHVRRTDMLQWSRDSKASFCGTKRYIEKAIMWYRNYFIEEQNMSPIKTIKYIFVMCSDDLPWCKRNFINTTDVTYCPVASSAIQDLAILSNCNYSLLTQGSFGWWAAYLARGKVTLYPTNYFDPDSPHIVERGFTYEDHFPSDWIGLSID